MIWILIAWNVLLTWWLMRIDQGQWANEKDVRWLRKAMWDYDNKDGENPDFLKYVKKRR